jgi:hypothetical protein
MADYEKILRLHPDFGRVAGLRDFARCQLNLGGIELWILPTGVRPLPAGDRSP